MKVSLKYLNIFKIAPSDIHNYIDKNGQEWQRIDSLVTGDVFAELYLIFNIPCQVLIKAEERSNLIRIPKDVFEEHMKEDYLDNMEAMIEFYRDLLFGEKIELKHLLPLAGVTQMRKVQGNVILVKQGDKSKYIYFVKSGLLKVMREIDFIKEVDYPYKNVNENYYQDPTEEDYKADNVKKSLLEIDRLERFNSFGDRDFPPPKYSECFEPFTIVSMIPTEIYFLEREVLLQLLPKNYSLELKTFPNDFNLRKRYYEQKCWKSFKNKVFKTLLNPEKKENAFSKRVSYASPRRQSPLKLPSIGMPHVSPSK